MRAHAALLASANTFGVRKHAALLASANNGPRGFVLPETHLLSGIIVVDVAPEVSPLQTARAHDTQTTRAKLVKRG